MTALTTLVIVLALIAVAILVWKLWKPVVRPPKEPVAVNEARLTMFYTEWCGFSKKAMPEWTALEAHLNSTGGYFGTTHVTLRKVDAEKDTKLAELYGINAYPTVILETKEASYDFKKRVTKDNLLQLLRDTLGQERESL